MFRRRNPRARHGIVTTARQAFFFAQACLYLLCTDRKPMPGMWGLLEDHNGDVDIGTLFFGLRL